MRIQGQRLFPKKQEFGLSMPGRGVARISRISIPKAHSHMLQPPEPGGPSDDSLKKLVNRYRQESSDLPNLRFFRRSVAMQAEQLGEADPISAEEAYARKIMVATAQLKLGLEALREGSSEGQVRKFLSMVDEAARTLAMPSPISPEERSQIAQRIHQDDLQSLVRQLKAARNFDEFKRIYFDLKDFSQERGLDIPMSDQEIAARRSLAKLDTSLDLAAMLRGGFRNTRAFERAWDQAKSQMDQHGIPQPVSLDEMRSRHLFFAVRELSQMADDARNAEDFDVFIDIMKKIETFCETYELENPLSADEIRSRRFFLQYNDLLDAVDHARRDSPTLGELRRNRAICLRKADQLGVQNPLTDQDVREALDEIGQKIIQRLKASMNSGEFRAILRTYKEYETEVTIPNAPRLSQEEIAVRQQLVDYAHIQNLSEEMKAVKDDLSRYFSLKNMLYIACEQFKIKCPVSQLEFELTELAVARGYCGKLESLMEGTENEGNRRIWESHRQEVIDRYGFPDL